MASITEFVMPKLGLTMAEGTVSEWVVSAGDTFRAGDVVVVVETDKIANEIEAPADGMLHEVLVDQGETVDVGVPIARWDIGAEGDDQLAQPSAPAVPDDPVEPVTADSQDTPSAPEPPAPTGIASSPGSRIVATPLARRVAKNEGVDLSTVAGSGPKGRIRADDVWAATKRAAPAPQEPGIKPEGLTGLGEVERLKATGYQAAAAKRLTASKQETPHFYLATEADAGQLLDIRARINDASDDMRISVNHLIIAAVARALADLPDANCIWDGGEIVRFKRVDVGVAVNTEAGLFVPILRDAGNRSLRAIAEGATELIMQARNGELPIDAVAGGAITVSNAGMHDVTYMTSIINPGQSSILGVGSVREVFRPDEHQQPVLRQELGLVLACDHRIFDGVSGLALLNRIKGYLESPFTLLLR